LQHFSSTWKHPNPKIAHASGFIEMHRRDDVA
jgi:hypothetical protein